MKILVTGAAGYIGSHLAERLNDMGHDVVGIDNFTPYYSVKLKELNAEDLKSKGIKLYRLDLAKDELKDVVSDIEVVYHLAAQPGISSTTPFELYLTNNFIATQKLLNSLLGSSTLKLFVNISTSSVYGAHATADENAVPKPTSHYGVTKLAAEQLALAYFRDKDFPACSMRLFSVYGERERPEKLYPKLIYSILNDKGFPLFEGSENHIRSYTYIGDIIDGLVSVLDYPKECIGEIFNIGTDEAITTGEGIKIVEELLGKKAIIDHKPRRAGDQAETHANIEKARKVLNYNPKVTPQEGLKREVDWFLEKLHKMGIDPYN
jgi:UDP-glucuronate 4-epimerase